MTTDLTQPLTYAEDDTPRRFKDIMRGPVNKKKPVAPMSLKDDTWTVLPGETFRDYNARIRGAGLTVPPGVPETYRAGQKRPLSSSASAAVASSAASHATKATATTEEKPAKKFIVEADEGGKTKRKRTEYLKQRKEKNKNSALQNSSDSEYERREEPRGLKQVVKAPPTFKVIPKAALKMHEPKINKAKHSSLLPILRAYNKANPCRRA